MAGYDTLIRVSVRSPGAAFVPGCAARDNGTSWLRYTDLRRLAVDQGALLQELRGLRGGVVDTSTLIYLERLELLSLAARSFSLLLIPQVIAEYGSCPVGCALTPVADAGTTDELLCRVAQSLAQPVLSEDRQVLRRARTLDLCFYNTLMLVLALCSQDDLPLTDYPDIRNHLCSFARYSPEVIAAGDTVYRALVRSQRTGR